MMSTSCPRREQSEMAEEGDRGESGAFHATCARLPNE